MGSLGHCLPEELGNFKYCYMEDEKVGKIIVLILSTILSETRIINPIYFVTFFNSTK